MKNILAYILISYCARVALTQDVPRMPVEIELRWCERFRLIEEAGNADDNADCEGMCNSDTPTGGVVLLQDELAATQAACFDYCEELSARIGTICEEDDLSSKISYKQLKEISAQPENSMRDWLLKN